jgi:hypothetical protein
MEVSMSEFLARETLTETADLVQAPLLAPASALPAVVVLPETDRTFELPTGLYVATVTLYLGFLGLMAATFLDRGLAIPMVIFVFFVLAAFGTPMMWARMNPPTKAAAMTFATFKNRGIMTATGRLGAGSAAVQVLVLPVLILCWGLAIAVIAATI